MLPVCDWRELLFTETARISRLQMGQYGSAVFVKYVKGLYPSGITRGQNRLEILRDFVPQR